MHKLKAAWHLRFIKLFIGSYLAMIASIWGFIEAYTYFKGNQLQTFLGPYWPLLYGIPLLISFGLSLLEIKKAQDSKKDLDKPNGIEKLYVDTIRYQQYMTALNWDGKLGLRGYDLSGRDLSNAMLSGADLRNSELSDSNLWGANLQGANLDGANLERADLSRANFKGARIVEGNLKNCRAIKADLRKSSFVSANLDKADLQEANFEGAYIDAANLRKANCWAVNFRRASLIGSLLQETNFRAANFERANLDAADFLGADLTYANLLGAWNLTEYELSMINKLRFATMPNGKRYDGRFNLKGDIKEAVSNGLDTENSQEMASWYEVSLDEYLLGQEWSKLNPSNQQD